MDYFAWIPDWVIKWATCLVVANILVWGTASLLIWVALVLS